MKEQKEQLDKVVDKILSYKPEKKRKRKSDKNVKESTRNITFSPETKDNG
jgi:hypothetical protein